MQPEPEHPKNPYAAALDRSGGKKRMAQLNTQEHSAFSKYALWARYHPREFKAEKAQRQVYLIKQILKDDKQLPL